MARAAMPRKESSKRGGGDDPVKRLSKLLHSLRPEGMPINILGTNIGVTAMTFHKYWHAQAKVIPLDFLQKIADYFQIPILSVVAEITSDRTPTELTDASVSKKRFASLYKYIDEVSFSTMLEKLEKSYEENPEYFENNLGKWLVDYIDVLFSLDLGTMSDIELTMLSALKERVSAFTPEKLARIKSLYGLKLKILEGKL